MTKGTEEPVTMDVESRARSALMASPIYALRQLNVERSGGTLLLSGRVETFYYKQMAQEAVRTVCDGLQVVNSVDVD